MIQPGDLVLVTGANGFVGSHLVEALLERGYRVRCMVRRTSDLTFIRHLPVEWAYADVSDKESLPAACRDVAAVCHGAALTRAPDRETFFRVNTQGSEALARAALEHSPRLERFVFISSQAASGPSASAGDVVSEGSGAPRPITWYGESKWAAEESLAGVAAGGRCLPLTVIRAAAVFGPRDRDFFSYFQMVQRGISLLPGAGDHVLSLVYVADLVDLVLRVLERDQAEGQTYFAASWDQGQAEFARAIAIALERRLVTVYVPLATLDLLATWSRVQGRLTGRTPLINDQRVRDMKQRYWLCSSARAARELGFAPRLDMVAAVRETAAWYRDQGWL